jgi:hypothetical protein
MLQRRESVLGNRLSARSGVVRLFATTPPPAHFPEEASADAIRRLAALVHRTSPDGIVVYDLQDESARNPAPRPYPFIPRQDAGAHAGELRRACEVYVACFKAIGAVDEGAWRRWLDRTAAEGIRLLVPVGRPVSVAPPGAIDILRSIALIEEHSAGLTPGSVVIAERDGADGAELRRMLLKQAAGSAWFVSQTVYDAPRTIRLLGRYARECRARGIPSRRVVLSFAPCGGERTLDFMQWLGIAVPAEIRARLSTSRTPLSDSIRLCRSNFRRIAECAAEERLPIGFCVESLSNSPAQVEASVDLFAALDAELAGCGGAGVPAREPGLALA